jgi:hypothetical protein
MLASNTDIDRILLEKRKANLTLKEKMDEA